MKHLTFKLILPLAVITFAIITKWWYALPVDGPDTMFVGFPFPYLCEGWHTSLSLQIFVTEFLIDFLIYFGFWWLLVFCIHHFIVKFNVHKLVTIMLWVFSMIAISVAALIASGSNHIFYPKRPFDIDIMETGYKFLWQQTKRPDYYKYHPENNKE